MASELFFHEAVKVAILNPDAPTQVRNVSTNAWVELSTAPTFANCVTTPTQVGATGQYYANLPAGLTATRAYPLLVYASSATAFSDAASEAEYSPENAPVNVTQWLGTAPVTPNTAGVPKVDTILILGAGTPSIDGLQHMGTDYDNVGYVNANIMAVGELNGSASLGVLVQGTIASTTGTTTTLDANATATATLYEGSKLVITSGTGAGQERVITAYTSGRVATHAAWTTNPTGASRYAILAARSYLNADGLAADAATEIASAVASSGGLSAAQQTQLNSIQNQTNLITTSQVLTIGPFATSTLTLKRGDSYGSAAGQTISIPKPTGASWPSLDGTWTVTFTANVKSDYTGEAGGAAITLTKACVVVDANTVRLDLTASDTNTLMLGAGKWEFDIQAAKSTDRNTLLTGSMTVVADQTRT